MLLKCTAPYLTDLYLNGYNHFFIFSLYFFALFCLLVFITPRHLLCAMCRVENPIFIHSIYVRVRKKNKKKTEKTSDVRTYVSTKSFLFFYPPHHFALLFSSSFLSSSKSVPLDHSRVPLLLFSPT